MTTSIFSANSQNSTLRFLKLTDANLPKLVTSTDLSRSLIPTHPLTADSCSIHFTSTGCVPTTLLNAGGWGAWGCSIHANPPHCQITKVPYPESMADLRSSLKLALPTRYTSPLPHPCHANSRHSMVCTACSLLTWCVFHPLPLRSHTGDAVTIWRTAREAPWEQLRQLLEDSVGSSRGSTSRGGSSRNVSARGGAGGGAGASGMGVGGKHAVWLCVVLSQLSIALVQQMEGRTAQLAQSSM